MGIGKVLYSAALVGTLAVGSAFGGAALTYKNYGQIQQEINMRQGVSADYGPGDVVVFDTDTQGNIHKYIQSNKGLIEIGKDNVPADISIVAGSLKQRPAEDVFSCIIGVVESPDSIVRKRVQAEFSEDPQYVMEMTRKGIKEFPLEVASLPYEDLLPVAKELMNRLPPDIAAKAKEFIPGGDSVAQQPGPEQVKAKKDSETLEFFYDVWKYYVGGN